MKARPLGDIVKESLGLPVEKSPGTVPNHDAIKNYFNSLDNPDSEWVFSADQALNILINHSSNQLMHTGKKFELDQYNEPMYNYMALYLAKDERIKTWLQSDVHKQLNAFSFHKGLLFVGSYGIGKSVIFEAASKAQLPGAKFGFTTTNEVVQYYEMDGPKYLKRFFNGHMCFDDFGTESKAWHYGKQVEIFKTIIEERYNRFKSGSCLTHISTNHAPDDIAKRYGDRVGSRLKEMFNIVVLTGPDRRQ